MNEPREFWIYKDDLDRAEKLCDLGDSRQVFVAFYPHIEYQKPNMVHVREVTPQDEKYKKALEEIAETVHDGEHWPTDSHIKAINIALVALGRVEHSEPEGTRTDE